MTEEHLFDKISNELLKKGNLNLSNKDTLDYHKTYKEDVLNVLKILLRAVENNDGNKRTYTLIKNYFEIK